MISHIKITHFTRQTLAKYAPEFLAEREQLKIKISPLKLRTPQQYHILDANVPESKTGVTPYQACTFQSEALNFYSHSC